MTWRDMFLHEWQTRLSRPAALASFVLFTLVLVYGAISGQLAREARLESVALHEAEVQETMTKWRADLQALEAKGPHEGVPPWSGSAMDVTFSSHLPPGPLADFAIGQSDLLPHLGSITLWEPDVRLFSRYEFADPVSLALGAFDLGKAILLVLPLLLIVVSFDVLSAERDSNRLMLTLAQGVRIKSFFWQRLLIRAGWVLGLTLLICLAALVLNGESQSMTQRLPYFVLWMLSVLLYGAFWIAMIAFIASRNGRGVSNVMTLLLAWAGFTLILPACMTAVTEALYPTPSRLAYLGEAREIEIETESAEPEITQQFVVDHPDLFVADATDIPGYVRTAFLVTSTVDAATRDVLSSFESTASQRAAALGRLRFASPTVMTHGLFNDIAGASSARHHRYMAQARAFKAAYAEQAGRFIVAGQRLPFHVAESLPRFHFEDGGVTAIARRSVSAWLVLAIVTGLLLLAAHRRLRHVGLPDT